MLIKFIKFIKYSEQKQKLFSDFMAMLSDPGAFTKGAEKQDEAMKGLGIEKTDAKAEEKKKKEEEAKASLCFKKNIIYFNFSKIFSIYYIK